MTGQILINTDLSTIEPNGNGGGGLPVGRHKVIIEDATQEAVKDKPQSGKLVLKLKCIEGSALNQNMNYNLNLWNENPEASRIAWQQLSAIGHVIGVYRVGAISDMFAKPFYVDVNLQKGDNPRGYTEITATYDLQGAAPGKQGQGGAMPAAPVATAVAPAAQAQPQAPATPPAWAPPAGAAAPAEAAPAAAPPAAWGAPAGQPGAAPAAFGAPAAQAAPAGGGWQPQGGGAPQAPWAG